MTITRKLSEETKQKISNSSKGRIVSKETREKISRAKLGKKRGPHSPETIEKIRESNRTSSKKKKWTMLEREIHSERMRAFWLKKKN